MSEVDDSGSECRRRSGSEVANEVIRMLHVHVDLSRAGFLVLVRAGGALCAAIGPVIRNCRPAKLGNHRAWILYTSDAADDLPR